MSFAGGVPGPIAFVGGTDEQVRTGDPLSALQKVELTLKHMFWFQGRASRSEFWWFTLAQLLIMIVLGGLSESIGGGEALPGLLAVGLFIPALSVSVRRLHDVGRTGWWLLIAFTIIGQLLLLWWYIQPGDAQPNRFNRVG